jgi:hypothetical protein
MCLCWWGRGVTLPIGGVEWKEGMNTLVGIDGVQCEIDIGDGMDAGIMRLGGRCIQYVMDMDARMGGRMFNCYDKVAMPVMT